MYLEAIAHASYQVTKPGEWLGRQLLPTAGQQEQLIELIQERFGSSFFTGQRLTLRASNLPLDAALVKTPEEDVDWRPKIDAVKKEGAALLKPVSILHCLAQRPDLDVFPVLPLSSLLQETQKVLKFFFSSRQRLGMVRKR